MASSPGTGGRLRRDASRKHDLVERGLQDSLPIDAYSRLRGFALQERRAAGRRLPTDGAPRR